jgi:hypothetical protein
MPYKTLTIVMAVTDEHADEAWGVLDGLFARGQVPGVLGWRLQEDQVTPEPPPPRQEPCRTTRAGSVGERLAHWSHADVQEYTPSERERGRCRDWDNGPLV